MRKEVSSLKAFYTHEHTLLLSVPVRSYGSNKVILALRHPCTPDVFAEWFTLKAGAKAVPATVRGTWVTLDAMQPLGIALSKLTELVEGHVLAVKIKKTRKSSCVR
ncbi:MAG: hypothetical protein WBK28_00685 [Minisyncoccia bacterium]